MALVRGYWVGFGALAIWAGAAACGDGAEDATGSGNGSPSGGAGSGASGPGSGGGSATCLPGLSSIALAPADSTVTLDGTTADPISFEATGTFDDAHSEPIAGALLDWTVSRDDDTDPGAIDDGVLAPNPAAGGLVTVTASDSCVDGSTTVLFYVDATIGSPGDPDDWIGTPDSGAGAPEIVYPSDQTRFPRNLYRTLFQWYSLGMSEFRLVFEGANSKVTAYTDGVHGLCEPAAATAGCWEVNELAWSFIAGSNAGDTAEWYVDGLDTSTDPPTIRRSEPIEIGFSKQDVEGAIFYWSTTAAGIRRGRLTQPDPEDYIVGKPEGTTYGTDEVQCVACHTFSRSGKYMVAPVKSSRTNSLWIAEVTADAPPTPLVTDVLDTDGHGFGTISPDDAHVVVAFKQDHMWMVDRETGEWQQDLATEAFGGGTHPDWSPTGEQLVFATDGGDAPGASSLALIPWDGMQWGEPTELLAPPNGLSNLFPMFDPTGEWIAFSQGNGGHGDNTAQLWVVAASGGDPIELENCNRVTNNELTDGQYQNSQPTWAPPGDYDWVAFNSKRAYGVVRDEGQQQIWVAAIDLDKADAGDDPSYPAFRVPFQGLDENNHRAFWTLDIGMEGSGGMGGGGSGGAGPDPCSEILSLGEACDPIEDCCETGLYCDTNDNGETYVCDTPS